MVRETGIRKWEREEQRREERRSAECRAPAGLNCVNKLVCDACFDSDLLHIALLFNFYQIL